LYTLLLDDIPNIDINTTLADECKDNSVNLNLGTVKLVILGYTVELVMIVSDRLLLNVGYYKFYKSLA
jgi:hypothetical protein